MTTSPLGNALKSAFKLEGVRILSDPVILYNILWDLGGFEDSTEVKEAVKSFVNDGYSKRLYASIKKYHPLKPQCKIDKLAIQVCREEVVFESSSTTTPELSRYIFDALRDALGIQTAEELHGKDKAINQLWKKLLLISVFLICFILAVVLYRKLHTTHIDININRTVDLVGNYSIRVNSESGESFFTGRITEVEQGEYSLLVVTEYGPERFSLYYNPDNQKLFSSKLGNGVASINEVTSSITLLFNNESTIWMLTK